MPATIEAVQTDLCLVDAAVGALLLELGMYRQLCYVNRTSRSAHVYDLNCNFRASVTEECIYLEFHDRLAANTQHNLLNPGSVDVVAAAIKRELRHHYRFFRLLERLLKFLGW